MNAIIGSAALAGAATAFPVETKAATPSCLEVEISSTEGALGEDRDLIDATLRYCKAMEESRRLLELMAENEVRYVESAGPVPQALVVRRTDAKLGLKTWEGGPAFDAPCDILPLRTMRSSRLDVLQRAAEIVEAYDSWRAGRKWPRGTKATERAAHRSVRLVQELAAQIAETPAKAMAGVLAKAKCVECSGDWEEGDPIAVSVARDLLQLNSHALS